MYLDNQFKTTLVLNRRAELGQLVNAAVHVAMGLATDQGLDVLIYSAADRPDFARISRFPVIVLAADNSNQLRVLHERATAEGVRTNVFTASMIGGSADEQMANTALLLAAQMEYLVVGLHGPGDHLKQLTKRHSLWR